MTAAERLEWAMSKVLISILIVLKIPFRLVLAQSYSLSTVHIDNFMFRETTSKFSV